jgi:putative membrane protein
MGSMFNLAYRGFSGFRGVCGYYGFPGGAMMGLVFIIIVGFIMYNMFKRNSFMCSRVMGTDPLEELKSKYVNGEITEEEYLRKREVLKMK